MDITSRKNEKVQHFRKLASSAAYRREQGLFVCDGRKLLDEAVQNGAVLREALVTEAFTGALPAGVRVWRVTPEVMAAASPLTTPREVLFSVEARYGARGAIPAGALLLENVQDPGNVGTMVRTANALGIPAVVFLGACADVYAPKCVRGTMGAVFREKLLFADYADVEAAKDAGIRFVGAALSPTAVAVGDADLTGRVVAVGNEGNGLTDRLLALCGETVIIPMQPACESLNAAAAAAILMWEMSKCRN